MRNVNLNVVGSSNLNPILAIDGKTLKTKKNKHGNIQYSFDTEKDEIELSVFRYLELNGRLWWLMAILFFVISIFGILNPPYEKKCIQIDYKVKLKLKENNDITIKLNASSNDGKVGRIETVCDCEEISNNFDIDKVAQKRKKIIKICEVIAWIALIVTIVALICKEYM